MSVLRHKTEIYKVMIKEKRELSQKKKQGKKKKREDKLQGLKSQKMSFLGAIELKKEKGDANQLVASLILIRYAENRQSSRKFIKVSKDAIFFSSWEIESKIRLLLSFSLCIGSPFFWILRIYSRIDDSESFNVVAKRA